MAFFDDAELQSLAIERMVFHLVGPSTDQFVRLEEVAPGKHRDFFLDRIRSVNAGLPYQFSDASATRERLRRMVEEPKSFQSESEKLAEDFQRGHGGSAASGAFLVFVLKAAGRDAFALLKYDDETVLSYAVEDAGRGRKKVSLEALERTFVQNREALQKSALIRLTDEGGDLTVLDRRNQQKVARYFETFLDAVRLFEDADLTERLVKLTRTLIRENPELVPEAVRRESVKRTYDAASGGGKIDAEGQKSYLEAVVGQTLPDDHPLVAKFNSALRKARIDGAPMTLDPKSVRPPTAQRLVTKNDILVRIPLGKEHIVKEVGDTIVIHDKVVERYDDADGAR